ncbi:hypothetical protein BKA69DRAFT_831716 [Paraphysoderma sedebokerense]|nr:hypothetical protein BKA69DRAFT_831716 [Paraphysoderma sedebokerense]
MTQDYWEIDDILALSQLVPCIMNVTVPGLGELDGDGSECEQLEQGSKVEWPWWLAGPLAAHAPGNDQPYIIFNLPKPYLPSTRNVISGSARKIQLNEFCPYWYLFGRILGRVLIDNGLCEVLTSTFKSRIPLIMSHASQPRYGDNEGYEVVRGLDETEKKLHRQAQDTITSTNKWLYRISKHGKSKMNLLASSAANFPSSLSSSTSRDEESRDKNDDERANEREEEENWAGKRRRTG